MEMVLGGQVMVGMVVVVLAVTVDNDRWEKEGSHSSAMLM